MECASRFRIGIALGFMLAVAALLASIAPLSSAFADDGEDSQGLVATTPAVSEEEQEQEEAVPFTKKGTYFIASAVNKKRVIGAKGDDRTNFANVVVCKRRNTNLLKYRLIPAGKGLYYVQNVATGRRLVAKKQTERKANAEMRAATKRKYQKWKIMQYPDGTVSFTNAATKLTLKMAGSGKVDANVNLRAASGNASQRFRLIKTKRNKMETVKLEVPCYLQHPQLPTGCESVALTNALRYWGFKLDKTTIANRWLPYGSNGVYNFIGNPHDSSGWIICAPGIANTAHRYLKSKNSDLHVKIYHGSSLKELRHYLDEGCPVIVWATDRMRSPGPTRAYRSGYTLRGNTHTMVLAGYSPTKDAYYLADSISGEVWRDAKRFESLYNKMGKQAVVIYD